MCGICGIYGSPDEQLLESMCEAIRHRGPDYHGTYIDNNVALGSERLAIIDISGGNQPMTNESQTIRVVFNGEIYNYLEIRNALIKAGHQFITKSDTEVIVHGYEEYNTRIFEILNGMFVIAIYDKPQNQLLLARDRFGIKPLYYKRFSDGRVIFASELKALIRDDKLEKKISINAIDSYLTFGSVPDEYCIFDGVCKLEPSSYIVISKDSIKRNIYYNFLERLSALSQSTYNWMVIADELEAEIQRSVLEHVHADVPVGAFLSGGIDSSAIVVSMSLFTREQIRTFSAGFESPVYDERPHAYEVANLVGSKHREILFEGNLLGSMPAMVWYADEPFAISSAMPLYVLSKIASKEVKVALSGDGSDEIFAGYPRYQRAKILKAYNYLPEHWREYFAKLIIDKDSSPDMNVGLKKAAKIFLLAGAMNLQSSYTRLLTWFDDRLRNYIYSDESKRKLSDFDSTAHIKEHILNASHLGDLNAQLYADVKTTLAHEMLTKLDRMTMAASLEGRVPFLDHKLVEFAFSIPENKKLNNGLGKWILHRAFSRLLPRNIISRPKHGFAVPVDLWFRDKNIRILDELLSPSAINRRGVFNPSAVRNLVVAHREGKSNHGHRLFALSALELWFRFYVDNDKELLNENIIEA